jgi:hypothetical protein
MRLPFDDNGVKEDLVGKPVVLLKNDSGSPFFDVVLDTKLGSNGEVESIGRWETQDGALRLLDKKGGLAYEFRGIETRNGCVYAVGRNVLEMPIDGMRRAILYPKVSAANGIGICVSSHVEYEEVALPKLLKSLELDGFDMKKVLVVVGGDKKHSKAFDTRFNVNVIRRKKNALGFTALCDIEEFSSYPYWLLLHDTCDVVDGFTQNLSSIDVGLNPDMILFRPPQEAVEIAIYSSAFVRSINITSDIKPNAYFLSLLGKARTIETLNVPMKKEPPKDIYGTGIKRETIVLQSLGIRKFRGRNMSGGKP